MARAKRTARADARRRYRAEQDLVEETAAIDDAATTSAKPAATTAASTQGGCPGDREHATADGHRDRVPMSFRPLDVRGDLVALPALALRTKALWIPICS